MCVVMITCRRYKRLRAESAPKIGSFDPFTASLQAITCRVYTSLYRLLAESARQNVAQTFCFPRDRRSPRSCSRHSSCIRNLWRYLDSHSGIIASTKILYTIYHEQEPHDNRVVE
jgi:hypothetical protein